MTQSRSLPRSALARPRSVRPQREGGRPPWRPWAKRALVAAFLLLVAFLLVRYARHIDWPQVWRNVTHLPHRVVAAAIVVAALAHLTYACFDLIGRHYVSHELRTRDVLLVGLIAYAFNLTLGSAVGTVAFRLRNYSNYGLRYSEIVRVVSLAMVTNWIGYLALAGVVFALTPLDLPPGWKLSGDELNMVGIVLVAVALAYLVLCGFSRTRSWDIRGHEVFLPSARMAAVQIGLSAVHWSLIAAVIWTLLEGTVPYGTVLTVFLIAAFAGVVIRVPAGLGVIEAVFVTLLSHRVPQWHLLGAILAFRAVFYILPLLIGALLYLRLELKSRADASRERGTPRFEVDSQHVK